MTTNGSRSVSYRQTAIALGTLLLMVIGAATGYIINNQDSRLDELTENVNELVKTVAVMAERDAMTYLKVNNLEEADKSIRKRIQEIQQKLE